MTSKDQATSPSAAGTTELGGETTPSTEIRTWQKGIAIGSKVMPTQLKATAMISMEISMISRAPRMLSTERRTSSMVPGTLWEEATTL